MKAQRLVVALTGFNLALSALIASRALPLPAVAEEVVPVLRGRAFELVDERGQVRSRLNVEPDGEVVLRLLDAKGTIRVKLGAGEGGSGLVLLDEATEPGVHLVARQIGSATRPATTSLALRGKDGVEKIIRP